VGISVLQNKYIGHATPVKQTFRHTDKDKRHSRPNTTSTVSLDYAVCAK